MNKKLPGIFANKITKKISNNDMVSYATKEEVIKKVGKKDININEKLNKLFNANRYAYKIDVLLTTKEGTNHKKVIGRNKTHLITMENELIPIVDVLDIEMKP